MKQFNKYLASFTLVAITSGCGQSIMHNRLMINNDGPPAKSIDSELIPEITPRVVARSQAGNPPYYSINGKRYHVMDHSDGYEEKGVASWYGKKFHGRKTSNGETYDMFALTAAHKTLPLPTYLEVTNLKNKRTIIVKVNDRGPFHGDRIIDLSYAAAVKLGYNQQGTTPVHIKVIASSIPLNSFNSEQNTNNKYPSSQTFLQIAAFTKKNNAEIYKNKLMNNKLSKINIFKNKHQSIYRIQIGPMDNEQETQQFNQKLSSLGITKTLLVKR
ncbi:MAG: septal ring lytic transglycosylase RlpA family protein [Methylococcales bacterium]|jgi:rare lipoprotein A|nr:septal ring lytic transglycosylase RlpA family protein [Methylococcales bacterium]MBT7409845.1 septal ring lytic transglycosylase RlpA family protein [Methylococcales bacterium]